MELMLGMQALRLRTANRVDQLTAYFVPEKDPPWTPELQSQGRYNTRPNELSHDFPHW